MSILRNSAFSMERARAAFRKSNGGNEERTPYYPFNRLPENKSSTVRFIPDANPNNDKGFLLERIVHELMINGKKTNVGCLKMYGEECPMCKLSSQYYNAGDRVNGKKFWVKRDWITRGVVVKDGIPPDSETGETYLGKVVTITLGKTLYEKISHAITSGLLGEDLPSHPKTGTDFIITRTVKPGPDGQKYNDYAMSTFARSSRALEDEEFSLIEQEDANGNTPNFVDLSTLLPKRVTREFMENLIEQALNEGSEDVPPPAAARNRNTDQYNDAPPARRAAPEPAARPAPARHADDSDGDDDDDPTAFLLAMKNRRAAQNNQD